jgi:glutamyl-Q tRNA(Asp) synthetase
MPPYVGRFAPSPTGDLHLGTLVAAAASYLHARQAGGEWLVRIEDIDPPREVPGSAESILRALDTLGLRWDRDVHYQSSRLEAHLAAAQTLLDRNAAYHCCCSRQQIQARTGTMRYPGTCRELGVPADDASLRLRVDRRPVAFRDRLRGPIECDIESTTGDFVIVRRDGLPAYHLAVVLDDAALGVTDIVRGADLLDSTPLHVHLQQRLGLLTPQYWHIPVVADAAGQKLSKSRGATAVDLRRPGRTVTRALELLGLNPPRELVDAPPEVLWEWARARWRIESLAGAPGPIVVNA